MVVRRPAPKLADSEFKRFLETKKVDRVVLGPIERHLIAKRELDPNEGRDQTVIHPSELAKPHWCQRAEYYKLSGTPRLRPDKGIHFSLETVFEEGHLIERKYQGWLWDVGILQGTFSCLYCGMLWWAESPTECARPGCVAGRECLVYREVPISAPDYRLGGFGDGELLGGKDGVEIKSIGVGTLRLEHPELLATHTHEFPDGSKQVSLDDLWRAINRPFPSHFKQGQLYGFMRGWERIIFVYECKWNQRTKEFVVKVNPEFIEDLLGACKDVMYSLKKGSPPPCQHGGCSHCTSYETGEPHGRKKDLEEGDHKRKPIPRRNVEPPKRLPSARGLDRRGSNGSGEGQGRTGQGGTAPSAPPRVRRTTAPGRIDRSR